MPMEQKVFIGGSRTITCLDAAVRQRLNRIIEKELPVLIGDAYGADKAVQQYFKAHHYSQVEVFCMAGGCRNNVGSWPICSIPAPSTKKDFRYYSTKDQAMADEASVGFMIWDGKSVGTLANVFRLISQHKKVAVYTAPSSLFTHLKNSADWKSFVSPYGNDLRERIEKPIIESYSPEKPRTAPFS